MGMRYSALEEQLTHRANQYLRRYQTPVEASRGHHLVMEGKRYLNFSSNNYLGLAKHPAIIKACQRALTAYGVGSGSAYLVTGYTSVHRELEEALANFLGYPRVLLLSSGYLANMGVISALFGKNDTILSDKLNHASLLDGCLLSKARLKRYPHGSVKAVEAFLRKYNQGNKLIISEGVFGMDGTLAPLKELSAIAARQDRTGITGISWTRRQRSASLDRDPGKSSWHLWRLCCWRESLD
jgi:8-amino-7-oxononanoate synthase